MSTAAESPLAGRVVAVTGASRGIGAGVAAALCERGARLALLARGGDELSAVADRLAGEALCLPCDVGDAAAVARAFERIDGELGCLDALVSNVGIAVPARAEHVDDAALRSQVDANLLGLVYVCRAAIPRLRAAGGGTIVAVSSDSASNPYPYLSVYAATKGALETYAMTLRREVAKDGIRVSVVRPGPTLSSFARDWEPTAMARAIQTWQEERVAPIHAPMDPAWLAECVAFALCAPPGACVELLEVRPLA